MRRMLFRSLLAILMGMAGAEAFAHDIAVKNADGVTIYYGFTNDSTELYVTFRGDDFMGSYAGRVVIPKSVTYEGNTYPVTHIDWAFRFCSELTEVIIPNGVKSISGNAFDHSSITKVSIPNSVKSIGPQAFAVCSSLTEVNIPDSVTRINSETFCRCTSLTKITIPNCVEYIEELAFSRCSSLTEVTIGNSVREISYEVFKNCSSLATLYSLNTTPPRISDSDFNNTHYNNLNVYVPLEALEAYQDADVWRKFKNIQGFGEAEKCSTPTIHYANNKLTFECATDGVAFRTTITDTDIATYNSNEIQLGVTYDISVYAAKAGYVNSDVATATLCWIDAEPKTDGISEDINTAITQIRGNAVLIQSGNGQITVTGLTDGTTVAVYDLSGKQVGTAVSTNGQTSINTNLTTGSAAIVKIGDRSIKITVK